MGATYTRQSSYADGDVIQAADTNDEFNQLLAAFAASTGHTHDGTTAEGGPITKLLGTAITIGDGTSGTDIAVTFDGETNDGVLTWKEDEDYFEFSDDILMGSTEKIQFGDTASFIQQSSNGVLRIDGEVTIDLNASTAVTVSNDLKLDSDAAVLGFGADNDVTLTHVADTGLLLNSTSVIQFNDASQNIGAPNATTLDINATDEVEINATLIDVNGNLDVSGTITVGSAALSEAELEILDGATVTTAELNIMDGDTTASSTTVADADRVVFNDNGTMKQVAVTDLAAYFDDEITAMPNLVTTAATTVGALNSGSITSGFGTIDTGSSTITTTGLISGGSLDIDDVLINGTTIGHTDDTDLITLANGVVTVAGEVSMTTLDIGGTNVTSTAAELNILDGVTSTAAELNILDGVTSTAAELNILDGVTSTAAELNILDGVTSTAAELNIMDGDTTASSTTVADADRVVLNDNGTMKQVAVTDLAAYFDDEITAMPNLVTTAATTVGALDSGSITSGFGTIDTGSSTITTTGLISGGSLDIDDVLINGTTIGHTDDTDLITLANGEVTVAGDITVGDDIKMTSDSAQITFGADSEITLTHVADSGLTLKHTATADDKPINLVLSTGETDMAANDVIGKISFQAPRRGTGTDAVLISGAVQARAEGDFSSSSNATSLDFMTGASEAATTKMTIMSSGNVGIGTTSPAVPLHVKVDTDENFFMSSDSGVRIQAINDAADAINTMKIGGDPLIFLGTGGTERMRIASSGKVAMGTSSADGDASVLTIKGTDPAEIYDGQIIIHGSATSGAANTGAGIGFKGHNGAGNRNLGAIQSLKENATSGNADAYMRFVTRSNSGGLAEAMRIDSSGDVGIGTTSITGKLTIGGDDAYEAITLRDNTASANMFSITSAEYSGSGGNVNKVSAVNSSGISFELGGSERMRLSHTSPALSIGKTTFGTAGVGYTVYGNTAPQCYFVKSNSGAVNGILFYHNTTYVGGLNYDNTNTSLATSSDERLKDNIENSDDAGAKIDAMQVRQFDWKSTGEHQEYGFVAQELEPVFAHAVHTDKEGDYKSVDYACLVPMLVKEIQTLRQRITDLENA